jgi:hypothetical protein
MNKRKQISNSIKEHNQGICDNCEIPENERNCKHCDDIDTRSAQDVIDDAGDEEYHLLSDEGKI